MQMVILGLGAGVPSFSSPSDISGFAVGGCVLGLSATFTALQRRPVLRGTRRRPRLRQGHRGRYTSWDSACYCLSVPSVGAHGSLRRPDLSASDPPLLYSSLAASRVPAT